MTAAADAAAVCRRVLFAFIYLLYYVAGAQNHRGIYAVYNGNSDLALLRSSLWYDFYRSQKFHITVPFA